MATGAEKALATVVAEARSAVAAGREPDAEALRARIRASGAGEKQTEQALAQLDRVLAIARARARLAGPRPAARPAAAPRPRKPVLRTRPTISGNMDVRRAAGEASALAWDAARDVLEWEIRFSSRPDPRRGYELRETLTLPAETRTVAVELGELPLRVHVIGRGRGGRLVRRAIVSGLTADNWRDRWQRRATAA